MYDLTVGLSMTHCKVGKEESLSQLWYLKRKQRHGLSSNRLLLGINVRVQVKLANSSRRKYE